MERAQLSIEVAGEWYSVYRFESESKNAPLLYLHGFGGTAQLFDFFAEKLNRTVFAIDLLGHGLSSAPKDPSRYSLENQLRDVSSIITALSDAESPAHLLGYSMGGRLAMRLALAYPMLFRSLIIESSSAGIASDTLRDERRLRDEKMADRIRHDLPAFFASWNRLPLFVSPSDAPTELRDRFERAQLKSNPNGLANNLIGFGAGTLLPVHDELKTLNIPLAILTGSLDPAYSTMWEELISAMPSATHFTVEGAGHRVHLDRPDAYIQNINHFLNHVESTS
jgi:2-succinyl-6-hydroxy-2,4-cyclohexadiene-1-carboxylate synthase